MQENLQQRLQSLQSEYEAGQKMLAELEAKQTNLRDTLLRISGAIQILEEVLSEANVPESGELPNPDDAQDIPESTINP